ncbi:DUF1656 domain-containing protein [Phenylobacterium sp.]|uniref:DUF1656 domain-containing protein n=1 Tax=Phenylobacterium sp. TaxID=1871053 RepID=UPI0035B000FD
MIGEINIAGVYVSSALVAAVIALAGAFAVQRAMTWLRLYRFVWHPALFDAAVFVIAWALIAHAPLPPELLGSNV